MPASASGVRCILHAGAVIGADGFGFASDRGTWVKVPQVGGVRIGDDVEIGANTTIDRGAIDDTVIEDGVKLDNLIQVGHNVTIGAHTAIAACTGISGSTTHRQALHDRRHGRHCRPPDDRRRRGDHGASAWSAPRSARRAVYSSGIPAAPSRAWRRMVAHLTTIRRKGAIDGGSLEDGYRGDHAASCRTGILFCWSTACSRASRANTSTP